jgi:hypothetical protein
MSLISQNPPLFPRLFAHTSDEADSRCWLKERRWPWGWLFLGMFLLCLIPRIWMACLVRSSCPDAYYYITVATFYQQGRLTEALIYLDLNIYPWILLGLNSLGLEWVLAGKIWSVLMSSLAVLPMFGWVRRLFCDQVAWAACFLYSMHSEFVELSMEVVRDPTFWFLFNLSLYATLRAVSEIRLRWFFLGGLTLALAVHIRSESWLLLIPFSMWLARKWWISAGQRGRLAAGGVIWLSVTPALIVLINLTLLRGEPEWRFGRLNHFVVGWEWIKSQLDSEPKPVPTFHAVQPGPVPQPDPESPPVPAPMAIDPATGLPYEPPNLLRFLDELALALDHPHLCLLPFGFFWLGKGGWTWDRIAMVLMSSVLAVAVWILYDTHGLINGRYFYPIYLAMVPCFATGLLVVANGFWIGARWLAWNWLRPQYAVLGYLGLAMSIGWADAFTTYQDVRERDVDLAHWLEVTHGPFQTVVTDMRASRAGYHVNDSIPKILHNWGSIEWQYPGEKIDLLLLSCLTTPTEHRPLVEAAARLFGLEPVALPQNHEATPRFLVFARPTLDRSP